MTAKQAETIDHKGQTHVAGKWGSKYLGIPLDCDIRKARANKKMGYLGSPKVKRSNIKMQLSADETREFIKCAEDPIYFIRTYCRIVNIDGGLIQFDMYDFQEEIIMNMHENRFSLVLSCRQAGKTITTTCYLLWYILFNSYKNIGILANKKQNATKALARLKVAYAAIPMWLQQGVEGWNKGDIELENGSMIGTFAAGGDAARGESFSVLMGDEIAFVPANVWDDYYRSAYPTISSGKSSKIMLSSTPEGLNHWYNLVQGARNGKNSYSLKEVIWSQVPGRDEKWKQETIDNTSQEAFLSEHENQFLGSSLTLISAAALRRFVPETIISLNENMKVLEHAKKNHTYMMSVDVAEGLGQDYSVVNVFDITEYPFKDVATYRNNKISELMLPSIIESIGKRYNDAYALVETNLVGKSVVQILNWEFEYPNIISTKTKGSRKSQLGLKTTTSTKNIGCNRLKDMIEGNKLLIRNEDTINEFFAFEQSGSSYEAAIGNDDCVMTCVNLAYYVNTPSFAFIHNSSFYNEFAKDNLAGALETLTPIPVSDNGLGAAADETNAFIDDSRDPGFVA